MMMMMILIELAISLPYFNFLAQTALFLHENHKNNDFKS